MKVTRLLGSLGLGLALGLGTLRADDPAAQGTIQPTQWRRGGDCCPPPCPGPYGVPPQGSASGSASGSEQQPNIPGAQDQFASAQEAGSGAGSSPANMFGDIVGFTGRASSSGSSSTPQASVVAITSIGGFKIAENDSPRPVDRVFVTYNFYDNVNGSQAGSGTNVHREMFGFEKTILDGNASFGLRVPFDQTTGSGSTGSQFGDLTITSKYAFVNDPDAVLSGGLLVTVPTGKSFNTGTSSVNPVFFQPWGGFLRNSCDLYVHGFFGAIIPTDSSSVLLLTSDFGVGYWVYRDESCDALISRVAPTIEIHSNNPLTHRYSSTNTDPIQLQDQLNLTGGVVIMGHRGSTFGMAVGVPLMGPKPFAVEGLASFNLKF